jgi:hypothetical protein
MKTKDKSLDISKFLKPLKGATPPPYYPFTPDSHNSPASAIPFGVDLAPPVSAAEPRVVRRQSLLSSALGPATTSSYSNAVQWGDLRHARESPVAITSRHPSNPTNLDGIKDLRQTASTLTIHPQDGKRNTIDLLEDDVPPAKRPRLNVPGQGRSRLAPLDTVTTQKTSETTRTTSKLDMEARRRGFGLGEDNFAAGFNSGFAKFLRKNASVERLRPQKKEIPPPIKGGQVQAPASEYFAKPPRRELVQTTSRKPESRPYALDRAKVNHESRSAISMIITPRRINYLLKWKKDYNGGIIVNLVKKVQVVSRLEMILT